jgi:hypothetical protein
MNWSGGEEYPELEKAGRVVRYMSASRQLNRSSFMELYPKGKPSDFVSWMFSDLGAAEWPPLEWELDEMERKGIRSIGIPIIPRDVGIFSTRRMDAARQIIVKADDSKGKIIIEGFLKPDQPSVLVKEWPFQLPQAS